MRVRVRVFARACAEPLLPLGPSKISIVDTLWICYALDVSQRVESPAHVQAVRLPHLPRPESSWPPTITALAHGQDRPRTCTTCETKSWVRFDALAALAPTFTG